MDDKTVNKVLLDVQKEYARSNKIKDKIIEFTEINRN